MSSIQWTDETWNPVVGCSKVSEGCRNCYAMTMGKRLASMADKGQGGRTAAYAKVMQRDRDGVPLAQWNNKVVCIEEALTIPLRWRKPRRVFVNSMSDLFHEDVPLEFIQSVVDVIEQCPQHTFQILTKRPELAEEMADMLAWPSNLWLGTSVENASVLYRVDELRRCPAAIRFISAEPLIGSLGTVNLDGIHWVIAGGESGPGARPCNVEWIRSIVRQCKSAGVPVFVKQLGSKPEHGWFTDDEIADPNGDAVLVSENYPTRLVVSSSRKDWCPLKLNDPKGGDINEMPEDLRIREMPTTHNAEVSL